MLQRDVVLIFRSENCVERSRRGSGFTSSEWHSHVDLLDASRDRGHEQNFISVLKSIGVTAEEADVLLVDVDIQKPAGLSRFVA